MPQPRWLLYYLASPLRLWHGWLFDLFVILVSITFCLSVVAAPFAIHAALKDITPSTINAQIGNSGLLIWHESVDYLEIHIPENLGKTAAWTGSENIAGSSQRW